VFFETSESLVPRDTNGVQDVYEWEAEGAGSCQRGSGTFSAMSGGCLSLLSTGRSPDAAYFADASENGDDAFLFTNQPLVSQDQDDLVDVYDARVDGGVPDQNTVAAPPCEGETCRPDDTSPPNLMTPSSTLLSGAGNLQPTAPTPPGPKPVPRPLTRRQKLAKALKACKKLKKVRRRSCEAHAQRRWGKRPSAKRGDRRRK
jgi:hypothetical protein